MDRIVICLCSCEISSFDDDKAAGGIRPPHSLHSSSIHGTSFRRHRFSDAKGPWNDRRLSFDICIAIQLHKAAAFLTRFQSVICPCFCSKSRPRAKGWRAHAKQAIYFTNLIAHRQIQSEISFVLQRSYGIQNQTDDPGEPSWNQKKLYGMRFLARHLWSAQELWQPRSDYGLRRPFEVLWEARFPIAPQL